MPNEKIHVRIPERYSGMKYNKSGVKLQYSDGVVEVESTTLIKSDIVSGLLKQVNTPAKAGKLPTDKLEIKRESGDKPAKIKDSKKKEGE